MNKYLKLQNVINEEIVVGAVALGELEAKLIKYDTLNNYFISIKKIIGNDFCVYLAQDGMLEDDTIFNNYIYTDLKEAKKQMNYYLKHNGKIMKD